VPPVKECWRQVTPRQRSYRGCRHSEPQMPSIHCSEMKHASSPALSCPSGVSSTGSGAGGGSSAPIGTDGVGAGTAEPEETATSGASGTSCIIVSSTSNPGAPGRSPTTGTTASGAGATEAAEAEATASSPPSGSEVPTSGSPLLGWPEEGVASVLITKEGRPET
jgi:hypothetical protein